MKSVVRPELSTAAAGSSQAPTAAVDNSAPLLTTPESTYRSGKSVQTTGATSLPNLITERSSSPTNHVHGVKRPAAHDNEGSTPTVDDGEARKLLDIPPFTCHT